jgi:hypothetical protein
MGLGERINTLRTPTFGPALPKVEGLSDARTPLADFFSILGGEHKKTLPSRSDEKVGGCRRTQT